MGTLFASGVDKEKETGQRKEAKKDHFLACQLIFHAKSFKSNGKNARYLCLLRAL